MNKITVAEMLNKLQENAGTPHHKTLFTLEDVYKLLENVKSEDREGGTINMSKDKFKQYLNDLFAKVSFGDEMDNNQSSSWIDDYDFDLELNGNEIEVNVHSFYMNSEMNTEAERIQDDLLGKVSEAMCEEFEFVEETPATEEVTEENEDEIPH